MANINIRQHPGWTGVFTTDQAEGAYPNGTRVEKAKNEKGDSHPIGAQGMVLGSLDHPVSGVMYFVEWDEKPKFAVATIHWKLRPLDGGKPTWH